MADETQMIKKKLTNVDYIDSLNNSGSFFVNQNNTVRQINKEDVLFDIVNGGTGAKNIEQARENLEVYSKEEIEGLLSKKSNSGHLHGGDLLNPMSIEFFPNEDNGLGGFIDFHHPDTDYNNSSEIDYTSRIAEYIKGILAIEGNLNPHGSMILNPGYTYGDSLTDFVGDLVEGTIFFVKV